MNGAIEKLCSLKVMVTLFVLFKLGAYYNKEVSIIIMLMSFSICVLLILKGKKEYMLGYFFSVLEFDSFLALQNFSILLTSIMVIISFYTGHVRIKKSQVFFYILFCYWMGVCWLYYYDFSHDINYIDYSFTTLKHIGVCLNVMLIFSSGVKVRQLNQSIMALFISSIIFISLGVILNNPSLKMINMGVGYSAQLFFFVMYIASYLIFEKKTVLQSIFLFLAFIATIFLLKQTNTISTQNLVGVFALLIFLKMNKSVAIWITGIAIAYFLGVFEQIKLQNLLYDLFSEELKIKIDNVFHSLENVNNIMLVPHSVQVRIIEIENITYQFNIFEFLFGRGVGGYFTDSHSVFPYLNEFDFSYEEIRAGVFFQPHNLGNLLLKLGTVFPIVTFLIVRNVPNQFKAMYASIYVFSMLNFGFTYYPSFLLGILLSGITNNEETSDH
ncbi:hypothetical protein AB6D16_014800 [Vibrio cyclitrophicus]